MTLIEIIRASAARMTNVTVETNSSMETVCIFDDSGAQEDIFMQGEEASEFIDRCKALYEEAGDVGMGDVELHVASPYAENLWN
jgi:hypothetical protein